MGVVRKGLLGVLASAALSLGLLPGAAAARLDTICNASNGIDLVDNGDARFAETFTVGFNGTLVAVEMQPGKTAASSTIPYVARIAHVDAAGVPTDDVLSSGSALPTSGSGTRKFALQPPLPVAAGQRYAAVLTRPGGGTDTLISGLTTGPICTGSLFESASQTGPWVADVDHLYLVTDITATPTTIVLTKHPKKKTHKTTARFSFEATLNAPKGVRWKCQLDKILRDYCGPPMVYKHLRPGKHHFTVWAQDAGYFGPYGTTTYKWRIKK